MAAGRLADALREVERPLLHALYRSLDPVPALRARLEASVDPAGEVLDTASPALGGLRRSVRVAHERLRSRLEALVHSELAGRPAGADRHAAQRPLRRPGAGRCQGPGPGHRPRPVGQRADPLRRAARRGGAVQRLARGAAGGPGRGGAGPRRALRPRGCQRRGAGRRPGRAGPLRPLALPGAPRRRARRRPAGAARNALGHAALGAPSRPERPRRAHRRAPRRRVHGARHHRSQHGRQDGRPAHASACWRSCTRPGCTCRWRTAARCPSSATSSRTSGTSSRWRSRCPRSAGTCAPSRASSRWPARARSCCSTSSAPAPTRRRARPSRSRCSTTSSAPAPSSWPRPTTRSSRPTRTTSRVPATPRSTSTWPRWRRRTISPSACRAPARPSPSPSAWGCRSALVEDARSRLSRGAAGVRVDAGLDPRGRSWTSRPPRRAPADAEQRARLALAEAEEERRRARAERRVAAAEARRQAEVALAAIEAEIAEMRGALARETLTERAARPGHGAHRRAPGGHAQRRGPRARRRVTRSPAGRSVSAPPRRAAGWARWWPSTRPGSVPRWTSAACALDVAIDELRRPRRAGRPLAGSGGPAVAATERPARRVRRAAPRGHARGRRRGREPSRRRPGAPRAVAASLDLRGARVEEALALLEQYLDDAAQGRRRPRDDHPRSRLGRHARRGQARAEPAPPGARVASGRARRGRRRRHHRVL